MGYIIYFCGEVFMSWKEFDKALEEEKNHVYEMQTPNSVYRKQGFSVGARWARKWIKERTPAIAKAQEWLVNEISLQEEVEKLSSENQRLREELEKFEVFGSDDCRNYMAGKCNGRITLYSVEDRLCVTCQKQALSGEVSE